MLLLFRDNQSIQKNLKVQTDNEVLAIVSSSVNQEMITPLKCVLQIITKIRDSNTNERTDFDLKMVQNTSTLLLNQVRSNLDRSLIMMDMFSPHLEEILQFEFIESTVDILSTTASLQDIKIEFVQEQKHDKIVIIDKLRVQQILINLLSNAIKF